MEDKFCQTCGCMYLWKHGCGETCVCEMCWECEHTTQECECEREVANV